MITFWIDGVPAAQGSKKHVGRGIMIEANKQLPAWRKAIKQKSQEVYTGEPLDIPLTVRADFFLPKPKKPRWMVPATALDLDKIQRALGDGLEAGGILKNDARIVQWIAEKHYATNNKTGCQVTITPHNTTATHTTLEKTP